MITVRGNGICIVKSMKKVKNTQSVTSVTSSIVELGSNDVVSVLPETITNGNDNLFLSIFDGSNYTNIIDNFSGGKWSNQTITTTTNTPDSNESRVLQVEEGGGGEGGILFKPFNQVPEYTLSYWVKFDNDTDHDNFTDVEGLLKRGGTLFQLGNNIEIGIGINIQFDKDGYLRTYVNGIVEPIQSVTYESTKYVKDTWYLISMSVKRTTQNYTCKIYINGIETLNFDMSQVVIDAFNQENNTAVTTLQETGYISQFGSEQAFLENVSGNIHILRDFKSVYYGFDLWKIYILDRELSDNEQLGFYQNPL